MAADFFGVPLAQDNPAPCSNQVSPAPSTEDLLAEVLTVMRPKPSPFPLVRLGGGRDGAYLVPDDLAGIGACFSPGVSNRKRFEDDLVARYGIPCHLCDASSDPAAFETPLIQGLQSFRKQWLDLDGAVDSISLDRWVGEDAADPQADLLLQMDIEGAEYRNLLTTSDAVLRRFRLLILEFHGLDRILDEQVLRGVIVPLFRRLDTFFVSVHAHPNNCYGERILPVIGANMPVVFELTFLRRDRFPAAGGTLHPPVLPHPQDVTCVRSRRPVHLNAAWFEGSRPLVSRLVMARDSAVYRAARLLGIGDPGRS